MGGMSMVVPAIARGDAGACGSCAEKIVESFLRVRCGDRREGGRETIVNCVGGGGARVGDVVGEALFQVAQPHSELGALLLRDGRMDEGIREKLPALLNVDPIFDGVRQHIWDQLQVFCLGLFVACLQQGQQL